MPVIKTSNYKVPLLFKNRHFNTIYPTLFRKMTPIHYQRTRIETRDNDFIDLDFSKSGSDKMVIVLHGLEGSSNSKSVKGMVHVFNHAGYDVVSMNFRGCSGEPNNALRYYHSGETDDLDVVVNYISKLKKYRSIHIVAFSMGGNILLKYLGEKGTDIAGKIKSAVALSVPCDLKDSAEVMGKKHNIIYMRQFFRELEQKLRLKSTQYPEKINMTDFNQIRNFKQFDDKYTAPMHGFDSAEDYWEKSSSISYLEKIRVPVLLINALDDPFLGEGSYPYEEAQKSPFFYLETPRYGGHVGFIVLGDKFYWSERRALEFITENA